MEPGSTGVTLIRRRKDTEKSTWRTHRYFVHFESRIHVKFTRQIDVIISTWIHLSKSM